MRRTSVLNSLSRWHRWRVAALWGGCWLAAIAPAGAADEVMVSAGTPAESAAKPADEPKAPVDVLVYNDGDRVRGRLVDRSVDSWLFMSERFGLLRVPLADAKIILGTPEAAAAIARADAAEARMKEEEAETSSAWAKLSPLALADQLGRFFGPWHGRFSFATSIITNTSDTSNMTVGANLRRKWTADNVELGARYDYSDTNDVTTTDILKIDASWRHDFRNRLFSIYSPTLEWNKAYAINGVPSNYVLLQQEVGVGVTLFAKPKRNLRVGIAENVFDVWQTSEPESHSRDNAESVFVELDWKLPWRMTLTERGVWYYSLASHRDGWENKLELDKKLTETFTIGVRHEVRHNSPDAHVQDYTLLKLLMGIDF